MFDIALAIISASLSALGRGSIGGEDEAPLEALEEAPAARAVAAAEAAEAAAEEAAWLGAAV